MNEKPYIPEIFENCPQELIDSALKAGIDLSLLEINLHASVDERILAHENTLQAVQEIIRNRTQQS